MMFAKELEAARSEAKRLHAEVDALKSGGSSEARHLECQCKQLDALWCTEQNVCSGSAQTARGDFACWFLPKALRQFCQLSIEYPVSDQGLQFSLDKFRKWARHRCPQELEQAQSEVNRLRSAAMAGLPEDQAKAWLNIPDICEQSWDCKVKTATGTNVENSCMLQRLGFLFLIFCMYSLRKRCDLPGSQAAAGGLLI